MFISVYKHAHYSILISKIIYLKQKQNGDFAAIASFTFAIIYHVFSRKSVWSAACFLCVAQ